MSCKLNFKAKSNCNDPTVLDYIITISGATISESLTIASTTSATSGVTFVGTTPMDGLDVDESMLTEKIEICFESFTTDCGLTNVNQCQTYFSLPKSVWSSDRLEPNPTTGVVSTSITNTKGSGVLANADCTPMRIEVWTEDYGLWETIYGRACDTFDLWTSDTHTLGGGQSILDHVAANDITNILIDKQAWANANGWVYAATGLSVLNGNQPITDTSNLDARTFAQEITLKTFVGSNDVLQDANCPSESINPDNVTVICKINNLWQSGWQPTNRINCNSNEFFIRTQKWHSVNSDLFNCIDMNTAMISISPNYNTNGSLVFTNNICGVGTSHLIALDLDPCPPTLSPPKNGGTTTTSFATINGLKGSGVYYSTWTPASDHFNGMRRITFNPKCGTNIESIQFIHRKAGELANNTINYSTYDINGGAVTGNLTVGAGASSLSNVSYDPNSEGIYDYRTDIEFIDEENITRTGFSKAQFEINAWW